MRKGQFQALGGSKASKEFHVVLLGSMSHDLGSIQMAFDDLSIGERLDLFDLHRQRHSYLQIPFSTRVIVRIV